VEYSEKKKICVIGGGATGVSFLWCLTSQEKTRNQVELTLLHDDGDLGGHSRTMYPEFGGKKYPVDVGVQYVCPLLYPNTYRMLELPNFKNVVLQENDQIRLAAAFTPQLNWGNFPAYQSGSLFEKLYTPENVAAAKSFQSAVEWSPVQGRFSWTIAEYLKRYPQPSAFVDYFLMPYLSILNGYGDDEQLRLATFEDLWPLFTPYLSDPGPLASFTQPGLGWQRFRDGSSSWINAMADYAKGYGATIITPARAYSVYPDPSGNGAWVVWGNPLRGQTNPPQRFDLVVLTTDMTTNRQLLNNAQNPYYDSPTQPVTQAPLISAEAFPLNPGSCYIHQDVDVLAPSLRAQQEIVQFTASYSQKPTKGLPYDMSTCYSTYIVRNMVPGLPQPVYVSMYGSYEAPNPPKNQLFPRVQWNHGRFLGSFMYTSKRNLHKIQGLGNIWFAGNNTTQDSEEGALTSAMIIAGKVCPDWEYPFTWHSEAFLMYEINKDEIMFPFQTSGFWRHFRHWKSKHLAANVGGRP
jgi:NAD(P)-binding Rossmann-like domain